MVVILVGRKKRKGNGKAENNGGGRERSQAVAEYLILPVIGGRYFSCYLYCTNV